jgi:hypothetical protein
MYQKSMVQSRVLLEVIHEKLWHQNALSSQINSLMDWQIGSDSSHMQRSSNCSDHVLFIAEVASHDNLEG